MKRIIIICEGQTEKEFCADVLYPFFLERSILLQCPLIKKHHIYVQTQHLGSNTQ